MGILFAGGEDICFTTLGSTSVDTATTAARRTGFARCTLLVGANGIPAATDGWIGALSAASSAFWLSARAYLLTTSATAGHRVIRFLDGAVSRLELRVSSGLTFALYKVNAAGTATLLGTASAALNGNTLTKIDIQVNYGTSGSVKIYYGGTLVLDTGTVDVTTDSATTLSGVVFGAKHQSSNTTGIHWSEPIVHTDDTRSMTLATMEPSANGNAFTFDSGSYTDVNETTNSDATIISSATANQVAQFAVTNTRITGNPSVKGLAVWARAQRGGTGPQNMQIGVRTASTDHWSANKSLVASMQPVVNNFDVNPGTSGAWGYTDLTAAGFNVGVKSIT